MNKVITPWKNGELCLCYETDLEILKTGLIDDNEFESRIIERVSPGGKNDGPYQIIPYDKNFAKALIQDFEKSSETQKKTVTDLINNKNYSLVEALASTLNNQ